MPRTSRYKIDTEISLTDFLFGLEISSGLNRNYTFSAVASFLAGTEQVRGFDFPYIYNRSSANTDLAAGEIQLSTASTNPSPFTGVTNIYISKTSYHGKDMETLFNQAAAAGANVILSKATSPEKFGAYKINSITDVDADTFNITVTTVAANSTISNAERVNVKIDFGASVAGSSNKVDATGDGITGTQNGVNTTFTVSQGSYTSGTLIVFLAGQPLTVGNGFTESDAASGEFDLDYPPLAFDLLIAMYAY